MLGEAGTDFPGGITAAAAGLDVQPLGLPGSTPSGKRSHAQQGHKQLSIAKRNRRGRRM
jgi:hypothetical protein